MTINTPRQLVSAYKRHGSLQAISRNEDMSYRAVRKLYLRALDQELMEHLRIGRKPVPRRGQNKKIEPRTPPPRPKVGGRIKAVPTAEFGLPPEGEIRRHLFTCAQNNTRIHRRMWRNLLVLAEHYEARVHVARFTYAKSGLGARGDKARVTGRAVFSGVDMWWDPDLVSYFSDERVEVAPGLVWCGEMNILPTATNPLSGLQEYTGRRSGIFPHVRVAMESIASGKSEATKFNYTTGTVTQRNYIQKKAGLKAEFHHCYAGLLVEVDHTGNWFCRQVNADSTGTLYDLNVRARAGRITTDNRVDSIYWGDGHAEEMDDRAYTLAFGPDGIKDVLRPRADFVGDVMSFKGRSHHELKDPHVQFMRHVQGLDDVTVGIRAAGRFIEGMRRPWCRTHAVNGNHERHLGRWLKEQDGRRDPLNAEFWIAMQGLVYRHIREGGVEPNYLDLALGLLSPESRRGVRFLAEDESVVRCPDAHDGIECGSHGDRGTNGSRGSARSFARMGRKRTVGHSHMAAIVNGVFVAGTFSKLDVDWTRGPSAWSHSHVVHYPNGKRAVLTCWNGYWAAGKSCGETPDTT